MPRQARSHGSNTSSIAARAATLPSRRAAAHVLVLQLVPSLLQLGDRGEDPFEQVHRLEARDDDRDTAPRDDRLVVGPAHDGAHVPGPEERLDAVRR